jgi:CHASE2 domain-containing sensor protein
MTSSSHQLSLKSVLKSLFTGLLVTFLVLFAKWCAEHTALYHGIQRVCYSWLQSQLVPPSKRSELPIVILDIRDLEYTTTTVGEEKFKLTPRKPLMELVEAALPHKPAAIGIDIDFSPAKFGYRDLDDPKHFRRLLELRQQYQVPIYLGINRSQNKESQFWLNSPEFESLAANIDKPDDNRKMFEWTAGAGSQVAKFDSQRPKELTMAKALQIAVDPNATQLSTGASWVIRQLAESRTRYGMPAREFLVDFSALQMLEDSKLRTIDPQVVKNQGRLFTGKAVLIGDGSSYEARDTVRVPLKDDPSVPGIYLHACAAYTLIKAPLYELTGPARFLADLVLALIVLISVIAARAYIQKRQERFAEKRATYIFIFGITIVVVLLGIVFIHKTRVIWDDFLFVLIALWIHPAVDHTLWQGVSWFKTGFPEFLRRMFSERKKVT